MTAARRLVPGQTHFVTRRARARCAFLLPTPEVKAIVLYALGRAQELAPGVQVHALTLEVTHTHDALTDAPDESSLPVLLRNLHSLTARALNARYGRGENLWRSESYDNVETHTQSDLEEQLLYVWCQPVRDGLVERPERWPGVLFSPEDFGRSFRVPKPEGAFFGGRRPDDWEPTHPPARRAHRAALRRQARRERHRERARDRKRGRGPRRRRQLATQRRQRRRRKERAPRPRRERSKLPAEVVVTVSPPPGYEHMTLDEVRAHFRRLLDARVAHIHAERREQGLTRFMGLERAMSQDPLASVGDTYPSFARNPRIACRDPDLRIALLEKLQAWHAKYSNASTRWRALDRSARFPWGSYWMPLFHGAQTEAPPRAPPIVS